MVHNHSSGDSTPSKDDVAMTKAVAAAAEKLGILLHDHDVVGSKGHKSMRSLGLLTSPSTHIQVDAEAISA